MTVTQIESLLIEATKDFLKNPSENGKAEVRYYASLLVQRCHKEAV